MFQNYLSKVKFYSLFKSKEKEKRIRFESFHRFCFILFSGKRGKFLNKKRLKNLFSQIKSVIQSYSEDGELLIMMFFCIRIIILKTDKKIFQEMFQLLWPILYNLIINIFSDQEQFQNLNLKLATLKLIELLIVSDYESFYLHYWSFGIDSCGFELEEE